MVACVELVVNGRTPWRGRKPKAHCDARGSWRTGLRRRHGFFEMLYSTVVSPTPLLATQASPLGAALLWRTTKVRTTPRSAYSRSTPPARASLGCFHHFQGKEDMVRVLASRAQLLAPSPSSPPTFTFFRVGSTWYYSLARDRKASNEEDVVHPVVSRFAVFLGAATFHPERYEALLHVLLRAFEAESGSPLALLQRVLSVSTKGIASAPGGADFVASKFGSSLDDESLAGSLSHAVQRLGAAACATLWAAMMLRCRVAVYKESDAAAVLAVVRALPLLTWHRRRWEVLGRAALRASLADEIQELNSAGTFVAGFTDPAILERSELYDVLEVSGRQRQSFWRGDAAATTTTAALHAWEADGVRRPPAAADADTRRGRGRPRFRQRLVERHPWQAGRCNGQNARDGTRWRDERRRRQRRGRSVRRHLLAPPARCRGHRRERMR